MDVSSIFLAVGVAIFVGFAANFLFRKYGAPDVLVLIFLGILFGPGAIGIVDTKLAGSINSITPYVAAIALAIIMFEAGMDLKPAQVLGSFKNAVLHTILAFLLSMVITAGICILILNWPIATSLVLGAILGGTSGAIVIPLVKKLNISDRTETVLTLEAALTDVLVIVVATAILFTITDVSTGFGSAAKLLVSAFLISTVIGLLGGIFWLRILSKLAGQPFSYMTTLATLVILYAVTELTVGGGGGAVAALVFGLVIGNKDSVVKLLRISAGKLNFEERIRDFNSEISFFVRTFFFVYLGLVFSTIVLTFTYVLLAGLIFCGLIVVRWSAIHLESRSMRLDKTDRLAHILMMPRGLSAAVLASVPLTTHAVPYEIGVMILGITVLVILMTTVLASIGAYYMETINRRNPDAKGI